MFLLHFPSLCLVVLFWNCIVVQISEFGFLHYKLSSTALVFADPGIFWERPGECWWKNPEDHKRRLEVKPLKQIPPGQQSDPRVHPQPVLLLRKLYFSGSEKMWSLVFEWWFDFWHNFVFVWQKKYPKVWIRSEWVTKFPWMNNSPRKLLNKEYTHRPRRLPCHSLYNFLQSRSPRHHRKLENY